MLEMSCAILVVLAVLAGRFSMVRAMFGNIGVEIAHLKSSVTA